MQQHEHILGQLNKASSTVNQATMQSLIKNINKIGPQYRPISIIHLLSIFINIDDNTIVTQIECIRIPHPCHDKLLALAKWQPKSSIWKL